MPELDFRAPRLFVDAPLREGERIALERNQSNYLGNVLRLGAGISEQHNSVPLDSKLGAAAGIVRGTVVAQTCQNCGSVR